MLNAEELELLEEAKSGDTEAFERLMVPYLPMLFASGRALCGDYHMAQDIVQETLLIAFKKLDRFFPEACFKGWLRAIVQRVALEFRRKLTKARSRCSTITEEALELYYKDATPRRASPWGAALAKCVQSLQGRVSRVVRSFYYEGMSLDATAASLGTTVPAAKQLVYRARLALKDCVEKRMRSETS